MKSFKQKRSMCNNHILLFNAGLQRKIAGLIAALAICCMLLPQRLSAQDFKGGIIAGLSTSQISGDGLAGYHQFGACIGGMAGLQFAKNWSAQFEILFIQKGSHTLSSDTVSGGGAHYYALRLNYIEVPILLNYHFKKFIFEAGPSIAVLISSTEEDLFGTIEQAPPFKRTDLSLNFGMSYPIYKSLLLNLRFSNSLLLVRDTPRLTSYYNIGGQYNSVIQFTFRYYFNADKSGR